MTRSVTPVPAGLTLSEPGAPAEPQRTSLRIGLTDQLHSLPLRVAADGGFLGQEAIEAQFIPLAARHAVPALVAAGLDVAVIDAATFIGERALGWDGVAIAAFGPVAEDRSVGVVVVELATWHRRRNMCERLWRASVRALERVSHSAAVGITAAVAGVEASAVEAARLGDWWAACRPSAEAFTVAVSWAEDAPSLDLGTGFVWLRPD